MGREFFHYDADSQTLMGSESGLTLGLGQRVTVRLAEAVPITGGLVLELLEVEGTAMPQGGRSSRRGKPGKGRGPVKRKAAAAKKKAGKVEAKAKRKVTRKRK